MNRGNEQLQKTTPFGLSWVHSVADEGTKHITAYDLVRTKALLRTPASETVLYCS